jgi:hypothetical protein
MFLSHLFLGHTIGRVSGNLTTGAFARSYKIEITFPTPSTKITHPRSPVNTHARI